MFLLQGCREENQYVENIKILTPHQDGVAKHITLKEFINETNVSRQQMKNSFLKINKRENSSKVSLSDFDIDTTFIKKLIYQNNKKSFSIRAYKKGEDPNSRIYNLVYHQDNGIWKADIFQYTYTREWLEKYNTNALTPFLGRIQHIGSEKNISLRTSETYECSSQIEYLCYCANHTTSECNGCSQGFRNVLTLNCVATGSGGSGGGFGGSDITPPPNLGTPPYNDPQIGGGGLGDGTEFEPNLLSFDDPMYQKYTLMNDLKNAVWPKLQNYPDLYKKFENFHLQTNGDNLFNLSELANYASSNYQFTDWIIDFWSSNLSLPWSQIKNWFMNADGTNNLNHESWFITKSEGSDGDYIDNLDNTLAGLQYQLKQMPSYSQFVNAFPKLDYPGYPRYFKQMPASQVYPLVGGNLENLYNTSGKDTGPYRNACTVRWSLAMNRMGFLIPNNSLSRQGANVNGNPRYYYLQAKTAGDYMLKTFGEVQDNYKLTGIDANDPIKVANFLKGKTGIYVIVNNDPRPRDQGGAGYTGHIDLIQNGHIPGGSNHLNVPGGIKYIRIWQFNP